MIRVPIVLDRPPTPAECARDHRLRRAFEKGRKAIDIRKNPYSRVVSRDEHDQWVEGFNSVVRDLPWPP